MGSSNTKPPSPAKASKQKKLVKNRYLLEENREHEDAITNISEAGDRSVLLTGSEDKTIRMWSTVTPTLEALGVLSGHTSFITCITIHDIYVLSGSDDNTIKKWDMADGECLVTYAGHTSRVSKLISNGKVLFSTSADNTARAWDFDPEMETQENGMQVRALRVMEGHSKGVYPLVFIPGSARTLEDDPALRIHPEDMLITGSADNTARLWQIESGKTLQVYEGHTGPVVCLAAAPSGMFLFTGSSDNTIRAWDVKKGSCLKVMNGHTGPITRLIVVKQNMFSCSQDCTARCWTWKSGDCTAIFKGHMKDVIAMKHSNKILFAGSRDSTVRAYDVTTGKLKRIFAGHEGPISGLSIINGRLFTASFDSSLRVWDATNLEDQPDIKIEDIV